MIFGGQNGWVSCHIDPQSDFTSYGTQWSVVLCYYYLYCKESTT